MINNNRIVPVMATDLITLYGTMIALTGATINAVTGDGVGNVSMASGSGNVIADEPVTTFNFGSSVTSATVYFIPAVNYAGFKINGTAVSTTGATVATDGGTLYKAVLATDDEVKTITISKAGF